MKDEIERKFLLINQKEIMANSNALYLLNSKDQKKIMKLILFFLKKRIKREGNKIKQGYLCIGDGNLLLLEINKRIDFTPNEFRIRKQSKRYFLTIKSDGTISRKEFEEEITQFLFKKYWKRIIKKVEKKRLKIPYNENFVEIDLYKDRNLLTAEIEFENIVNSKRIIPIGKDITDDKKFKNKNLAK